MTALLKRTVRAGLIIHSDLAGQYLSNKTKELVAATAMETFTLKRSMSRADDKTA